MTVYLTHEATSLGEHHNFTGYAIIVIASCTVLWTRSVCLFRSNAVSVLLLPKLWMRWRGRPLTLIVSTAVRYHRTVFKKHCLFLSVRFCHSSIRIRFGRKNCCSRAAVYWEIFAASSDCCQDHKVLVRDWWCCGIYALLKYTCHIST